MPIGSFRLNTLSKYSAPAGLSYSYSSNTTSSTSSISVSSFATGSLMILVSTAIGSGSPPGINSPSGWTQQADISDGNSTRTSVYTRIKVAGDSTASVMTGALGQGSLCLAYTPSKAITTITPNNGSASWGSTARSITLPMTSITGPYVMIGVTAGYTSVNTVTNTVTPTRTITSNIAKFTIYESTSSSVSFSTSTMSTDDVGFQLATYSRLNLA